MNEEQEPESFLPTFTRKKILSTCKFEWKTALIDLLEFKPKVVGFNPYRGCMGCTYCWVKGFNARFKNIKPDNDFSNLELCENVYALLEKELPKLPENHLIIACTTTDLFQPILNENTELYDLVGSWLELLYDYNVLFITKNGVVLRKYLEDGYFNNENHIIGVTITTTKDNEAIRKIYEPNSSTTNERYEALFEAEKRRFRKFVSVEPPLQGITTIVKEIMNYRLSKTWIVLGFANYRLKDLWSKEDYIRWYRELRHESTVHNKIFWKDECLSKISNWIGVGNKK